MPELRLQFCPFGMFGEGRGYIGALRHYAEAMFARVYNKRLNQFAGREYAFGRLMYYNRILALPDLLGSGVYVGGSAEVGMIRDRFDGLATPGTLYSGSLFVGADTFAGPAYLGAGFGNAGAFSVYLLLGAP